MSWVCPSDDPRSSEITRLVSLGHNPIHMRKDDNESIIQVNRYLTSKPNIYVTRNLHQTRTKLTVCLSFFFFNPSFPNHGGHRIQFRSVSNEINDNDAKLQNTWIQNANENSTNELKDKRIRVGNHNEFRNSNVRIQIVRSFSIANLLNVW